MIIYFFDNSWECQHSIKTSANFLLTFSKNSFMIGKNKFKILNNNSKEMFLSWQINKEIYQLTVKIFFQL